MIIAILAAILGMFAPANSQGAPELVMIHATSEVTEWNLYYREAEAEYADEFTALFNSYETKRAKNGALMIRQGDSGSYRFAKRG